MSRATPTLLSFSLLLLGMLFGTARSVAADFVEHLPGDCLAAVRLQDVKQLDQRLRPLAGTFGIAYPPIGHLLDSVTGTDASGALVVGVARLPDSPYHPFALVPVTDYEAFVRAGEGDPAIAVTPVTLLGEELLATQCGEWALVTNPTEHSNHLRRPLDEAVQQRLTDLVGDETVALLVTEAGLRELHGVASTHEVSDSRRRLLRMRQADLRSLDYWRDLLALREPVVSRVAERTAGLVLGADVAADKSVAVRLAVAAAEPAESDVEPTTLPTLRLEEHRAIVTARGPWGTAWSDLWVQLELDALSTGSDGVGIDRFPDEVFAQFRESALATQRQVRGATVVLIDPADEQPTMSISAYVLQVADSAAFVKSVDELVSDWNRMVEAAQRSVDFYYERRPIRVDDLEGRRYAVDLPSAFRATEVPEVRDVLAKLYGRNGELVIDVLPVTEQQVLISDLPDAERNRLASQLAAGQREPEPPAAEWTTTLVPAALQDWLNKRRSLSYGGNVVGWHPRPLECSSPVQITIVSGARHLTAEAEVPSDVVEALGMLLRE